MRPALVSLGAALLWLPVAGPRPAAAEILAQVAPVETTIVVVPGTMVSWAVTVRNLGDAPVRVRPRLADWRMSVDGALDLLAPGTTPVTLAGFLSFDPPELMIEPGAEKDVRLTAALPDTGPSTRYGVLLSEVRPAGLPGDLPLRRVPAELGTTVFLTRPDAQGGLAELAGLNVRPEGDSTFRVTVRIWNGSERALAAGGDIEVADSTGVTRVRGRLGRGIVPPRSLRALGWSCETPLDPGRYSVTARLDVGPGEPVLARTPIVWPMGRPLVLDPGPGPR